MQTLTFKSCEVLLEDDKTYLPGSSDNRNVYRQVYHLNDGQHVNSSHAIRVLESGSNMEIDTCILLAGDGGATGIHQHSALINGGSLIVAVGKFIASLNLPTLHLNWKTQSDTATCFGVHHSTKHNCYLSHGELEIARLSYNGSIDWSNAGTDIFTNGFQMHSDSVQATDWNDWTYLWDIRTGNSIPTSNQPKPS